MKRPARVLAVGILLVSVTGCGTQEQEDRKPRVATVGQVLDDAVDATLAKRTGTYATGFGQASDVSVMVHYDLKAHVADVDAKLLLGDGTPDSEERYVFQRRVVGGHVFVREGEYEFGVSTDPKGEPWIDVTGSKEFDTAIARRPEGIALLEALEVPDQRTRSVRKTIEATVPTGLVYAVLVPGWVRPGVADDKDLGRADAEVLIVDDQIVNVRIDVLGMAKKAGKNLQKKVLMDGFRFDPSYFGTVNISFTGLGDAVSVEAPRAATA